MSSQEQLIDYHNGDINESWAGEIIDGMIVVLNAREGRQRNFFILPDRDVMISTPPWYDETPSYWGIMSTSLMQGRQTKITGR